MTIDAAVIAKLKATTAITAIVGQRIYPDSLPLTPTLPALRVSFVDSNPDNEVPGFNRARVQISCYSNPATSNGVRSPAEVMSMVKAIKDLFHKPRLNSSPTVWSAGSFSYSMLSSQVQVGPRTTEDVSQYYHVPVDVLVQFRE